MEGFQGVVLPTPELNYWTTSTELSAVISLALFHGFIVRENIVNPRISYYSYVMLVEMRLERGLRPPTLHVFHALRWITFDFRFYTHQILFDQQYFYGFNKISS